MSGTPIADQAQCMLARLKDENRELLARLQHENNLLKAERDTARDYARSLMAIVEAARSLREAHKAYMLSPSFHTQMIYEGTQLILDRVLSHPYDKETGA